MPSLLPEDECGAQQDPRHVDGRLQVLGVGELAVDAHADGDAAHARSARKMYGRRGRSARAHAIRTDAVLAVLKLFRN